MTRKLVLVNLSNYDGEDYDVVTRDHDGNEQRRPLKPGESVIVPEGHKAGFVHFEPTEGRKPPESFRGADGRQMFPTLKLSIE